MPRRHRLLRVVAGLASVGALGLTIAAGSVSLATTQLEANVTTIDVSGQVGPRPVSYGDLTEGPVTFLLMGSDSRTGEGNTSYGYFEGARSDTTMLLHVYPDRQSAIVVSIPRDMVTQLPACVGPDGTQYGQTRERFNSAFDRGGPGCTIKTVEAMTGVHIDHFVVLDFNGFKRTINALGGVEVCLNQPVVDKRSGLDLPAGRTRVTGQEALAFVRVRHNIGDGSDISRINRQQLFTSSLIQEITSSQLLTDPMRLWSVLDQTTKSIGTDAALADSQAVLSFAANMAHIRPDDITFVTVPWLESGDGATVVADQPRADQLWKAIGANEPWPPPPTTARDGAALTVVPGDVTVHVHNATGIDGLGARTAEQLRATGFRTRGVDTAGGSPELTVIRHAPDQAEAARTLQAAIPNSVLLVDDTLGADLDLTLGSTLRTVEEVRVTPPAGTPATPETGNANPATAAQDICTG